jgi:methionyl-tRNA synthetase
MKSDNRYTVTAALPYANGPVHIGHLAGVYVPSDIYVRYLRSAGKEVLFVCGSDEHGVPITIRAKKEGVTPQQVVDKYHEMIKKSFQGFGITFDVYSRTSSEMQKVTASEFFTNLNDKGLLNVDVSEQYYDEEAKQFLADRYIIGTCPNCAYTEAYGDQCENCGRTLSPTDLLSPRSALSGSSPTRKETKHWYLPLNDYEDWLKEWIVDGHKNDWKVNVYGQCKSWIDQGLQPRAVTRDLDWGVPVPLDEAKGKVLYVWFDAPIGYISATKEWAERTGNDWETYWKGDESQLIHFIGKDNIVFHCIIFPVMLKAHGDYNLPFNVPANEFLNLENNKISTSRNWAVWLHEYLEDFPGKQDVLRYVLTANAPETKDNDFTWKDFQARNNNELVAILGNFVNRVFVLTFKYFDGIVPERETTLPIDDDLINDLAAYPEKISASIEAYKFREALMLYMELARNGNKYLAETEPWKLIKEDKERVGTILNLALQIVANLGIMGGPFLPDTSQKIDGMIGNGTFNWSYAGQSTLVRAGEKLNSPALLFEKIEDEAVNLQIAKLESTKETNKPVEEHTIEEQKDPITFDEFTKMDIRIGEVLHAEAVPKSSKLLKLTVDTGIDQRTVVSGISKHYKPEEIVGSKVTILANLAPRNIMGIESKGMILMGENVDGKLSLLAPDADIENGSLVS